jgi:hypothetical protein
VAQGVGSAKINRGGQDVFGGHLFAIIDYYGPLSYVQGGDAIDPRFFGFDNIILSLTGTLDFTFTFRLEPLPMRKGYTSWRLVWTVYGTGQEVSAGTNLSKYAGKLTAIGY